MTFCILKEKKNKETSRPPYFKLIDLNKQYRE